MRRFDIKIIPLLLFIIFFSIFMIYCSSQFESHIAETVGPGIYPLIILILMIAVSLMLIFKAFTPPKYRLISPFNIELGKGIIVKKIADILSKETGSHVRVVPKTGEGFFSSYYAGSEAISDGKTLTVLTGDIPTAPNFLGASKSIKKFEPIMGLSFEPDILIVKSESNARFDLLKSSRNLKSILQKNIGFSHSEEIPYYLREVLSKKCGFEIKGFYFNDTKSMIESLEDCEINAGFCPLTHVLKNEEFQHKCEIIAVASSERIPELPDIPNLKELGIDIVSGGWMGLGCPRETNKTIINRIYSLLSKSHNLNILKKEMNEKGERGNIQDTESFHHFLISQQKALDELGLKEDSKYGEDLKSLYRVLGTIGLFIIFILIIPYVGFLATSFAFLLLLSIILWPTNVRHMLPLIFLVSAGVSLGIYMVFSKTFNVVFP